MRRLSRTSLALLVLSTGCTRTPQPADPQLVAQWLRTSIAFVRSERLGPPVASRISAYASIALYEGYASDPRSELRSLAGQLNGLTMLPAPPGGRPVDGAVVAAEAERVVLDSLFSDGYASTRRTIDSLSSAQVQARRVAGVGGDLRERSVAHGRAHGNAIHAWAAVLLDDFVTTAIS